MKKVPVCVGLGEVLFDLLPTGPVLGGAPANFVYTARALGADGRLVSAVGKDEWGEEAARLLAEKGIPAVLSVTERVTGHVRVHFSGAGIPSYHFAENPAYEEIPFTEETARLAEETNICCFGTMAQWGKTTRETVMRFLSEMREESLRVFDVNLRGRFFSKEIVDASLARSDLVKCNEEELPVLCRYAGVSGEGAERYYEYLRERFGVRGLIYTEGAKRSTVYLNGDRSVLPTPFCEAVDTVGAGDAFTAAFVLSLYEGKSLRDAHERAVEIAAFACTRPGGMPDYREMGL